LSWDITYQDFEPLFYSPDSTEYKKALDSYGQIRRMKYFTKTDWTKETVLRKTGIFSKKVGISVDIDLFSTPFHARNWKKTCHNRGNGETSLSLSRTVENYIGLKKDKK